jgi:4-amino-4-deoxy-L-arabinose transferase-like glycosyltransferase
LIVARQNLLTLLKFLFLQATPLSNRIYVFLFSLLGLVYIAGLFVPLMDNDSAHHANIALHMYLNRDLVNLVDNGNAYLDKPHLHFWLAALSYKIFGVTPFAYRLPSFLFTLLGIYSAYRLGKSLYDEQTGKLSALMLASAFAFMLANTDVRMDAILTACIAFATWQGVDFIQTKKISHAPGLALGLALGFSTKGHIAVFTPGVGLLFYMLYRKNRKDILDWKWIYVAACFVVFIFPVVYCYYLQFNLHPETVVRGHDHINGVKFILFGQSVERFQGDSFGSDAKNDRLFFFHSFLWAFAPWSILAYVALVNRLRQFFSRRNEWLTAGSIVVIALLLTFSGFKLPHYLNIIFPAASVMTASWCLKNFSREKIIFTIQAIVCTILLMVLVVVNAWAFPVQNIFIIAAVVILLSITIYFLKSEAYSRFAKAICISVATMVLAFFVLNTNFYPQLLRYQGGNEMAKLIKGNVDPANVYFWKDNYSSSFNFCTITERKQFTDSLYALGKRPVWLLFDRRNEKDIDSAGYRIGTRYVVPDFEITRLSFHFINPATRKKFLNFMVVGEITEKQ